MDFLIGLTLSVLGKFLGTEMEAWAPAIAKGVIEQAVQRLPESERERFQEEWIAHLNECPGNIAKVLHAVGCFRSAKAILAAVNRRETKKVQSAREICGDVPRQARATKAIRAKDGILATFERQIIIALVKRVPASTSPDRFSAVGVIGAVIVMLGLVACRWSSWCLIVAILGLFLNWLGESLDDELACFRKEERLRYGYMIDHFSDIITQTLILIGLGLSPYFTLPSALFMMSLYLLLTSYLYLQTAVESVHQRTYVGMGTTEFRVLIVSWVIFAAWIGPGVFSMTIGRFILLDVVVGLLTGCSFACFAWLVQRDLARMH